MPVSRPELIAPDGDADGLEDLARTLFGTAVRYEDFADTARAARPDGTWSGVAFDAYVGATRRAAVEHEALAVAARRVALTCTACADTLADLLADFRRLEADKAACDVRRAWLRADVVGAGVGELVELRRRAAELDEDYAVLTVDHAALRRRIETNEQLLVRAFTGSVTLAQVHGGHAGVDPLAREAMRGEGAPGPGARAGLVRAWWAGLDDARREAVLADHPRLVGDAPGLPAGVRDQANRVLLDDVTDELEQRERDGALTAIERRELATARATRLALSAADAHLDPLTGRPAGGVLWAFDPGAFDGQGRVAVGVGDLDTATDVSVRVPGVANAGDTVAVLAQEALHTYDAARADGDGSSVAGLAWMGYDAPDGATDPATYHLGRAVTGAVALAGDLAALRASRPGDPAHLTVIGHSYGSTTVGLALAAHHADVDDVVLVGSPGAGVDRAADLGVATGHVWVGADSDDLVTYAGHAFGQVHLEGLGPDPAGEGFGATRFAAEDPARNGTPDLTSHGTYFTDGSESLGNIGRVVDGTASEVRVVEPRQAGTERLIVDGGGHVVSVDVVVDPEATRPLTVTSGGAP